VYCTHTPLIASSAVVQTLGLEPRLAYARRSCVNLRLVSSGSLPEPLLATLRSFLALPTATQHIQFLLPASLSYDVLPRSRAVRTAVVMAASMVPRAATVVAAHRAVRILDASLRYGWECNPPSSPPSPHTRLSVQTSPHSVFIFLFARSHIHLPKVTVGLVNLTSYAYSLALPLTPMPGQWHTDTRASTPTSIYTHCRGHVRWAPHTYS
jgi:hypothetical protein